MNVQYSENNETGCGQFIVSSAYQAPAINRSVSIQQVVCVLKQPQIAQRSFVQLRLSALGGFELTVEIHLQD